MEGMDRRRARRRLLLLSAGSGVVLASVLGGIALLALPSPAAAADPCPPGAPGTLSNISRAIVPIGVTVIRGFNVLGNGVVTTNLLLTAPPEYNPKQIPGNNTYVLRLKAPHAGPFDVHATWTQQYTDNDGVKQTCSSSGDTTLNGSKGKPLVVTQPPGTKKQYDNPIIWGWRCTADSDPIPQLLTLRWESDPRPLPLFFRGGKPPFKFTKRAKTIKVTTADPCDGHQVGGFLKKRLAKNAKLSVILGGNATTGAGGLLVKFGGEFRNGRHGDAKPLHLGIILRQGSRTLVNVKVCTYWQLGFEIAKGKGVNCWR
jgi:hypothetical protein